MLRLCGCRGSLTAGANGRVACLRHPEHEKGFACSRFTCRNSSAAKLGSVTARARSVFGDLNRNPALVCSRLSTIRAVPKSTLRQLSAKASPRRMPVASARSTGQEMCECRTASSSRANLSAVRVANSWRSTLGSRFR